ncbi:MAG: hypothetical protein L6Q54_05660 [Leptospiraceae bacterium]|nr:hypothetical protein [Leptospiraceae bacterium]MCK6380725.1 hypothetical protein [Leptospiraceae bacterium]NUM41858.1 hypothetical protein [Leptospiraceae bacterium]
MDVQIVNFINSAKELLKDKKSPNTETSGSISSDKLSTDSLEFSSGLAAKYTVVQNKLRELQNDLSKEQTKLGVLSEEGINNDDLINILFGNTPLFSEADLKAFDREKITQETLESKDEIMTKIKSLEVESENIFSIGMLGDSNSFTNSIRKLGEIGIHSLKPISGSKVEKLIKD